MKLLCALIGLMTLAALPVRAADHGFEGLFVMRVQDDDGTRVISCAMKPDFLRAEIPSDDNRKIVSLVDFMRGEVAVLVPGQSLYAVMPVTDAVAKLVDARRARSPATILRKTDETAVILGRSCTKYQAQDENGSTEIWMAAGFGSPRFAAALRSLARSASERELLGQGAFPLRIVGKDAGRTTRFRMDVVSLDKKPVADGFFLPPADYRKLDVGDLLPGGFSFF